MTRVAVIDIGTNSTRLLVADVNGRGEVAPLHTDLRTTRLGQGVGGGGALNPEAVFRTVKAIFDMQDQAREKSVSLFVAAATSAVRDAANREWFLDEVRRKTGLRVRVLNGHEEAFMSYSGVVAAFGEDAETAVVVDIGGGSTEFTWVRDGRVLCRSVDAGAVRMTGGGHSDQEIHEILRETMEEAKKAGPRKLIGVGGTVTTLAAMDMALEVYDRTRVHGYSLFLTAVVRLLEKLLQAGPEGRKRLAGLQPAREDIIVAGVRILTEVMKGLEFDRIMVSEADLLYGLALDAVKAVETN